MLSSFQNQYMIFIVYIIYIYNDNRNEIFFKKQVSLIILQLNLLIFVSYFLNLNSIEKKPKISLNVIQGFSTLALLIFWPRGCCGGRPVHCKVFISITDLYLVIASSNSSPFVATKCVDTVKYPLDGGQYFN